MTRTYNGNGTLNSYIVSPFEVKEGDRYGYKVVAVVWDSNSWCAFRGLTDWTDDYVQASGEKIPFDVAKYLFPSIADAVPNYENY